MKTRLTILLRLKRSLFRRHQVPVMLEITVKLQSTWDSITLLYRRQIRVRDQIILRQLITETLTTREIPWLLEALSHKKLRTISGLVILRLALRKIHSLVVDPLQPSKLLTIKRWESHLVPQTALLLPASTSLQQKRLTANLMFFPMSLRVKPYKAPSRQAIRPTTNGFSPL